jgi:hypothetical protein
MSADIDCLIMCVSSKWRRNCLRGRDQQLFASEHSDADDGGLV